MENSELVKRALDLAKRAENRNCLTESGFLTPAEQYELSNSPALRGYRMAFRGGFEGAERAMAFFLPDYMEENDIELSEYMSAIKLTAHFGVPGHRDYMGAILGMGVSREWVGDITVAENTAVVICRNTVLRHLMSIDKVGRYGVSAETVSLESLAPAARKCEERSFTVMSLRLDAVCAGMFHISRTEAARQISAGNVSLNYSECLRADAPVKENDIISIRGAGKGKLSELGGSSRKGRLFVTAEVYR